MTITPNYILIELPKGKNCAQFYISGTGYLCCRQPHIMCLSENSLIDYGITHDRQIGEIVCIDGVDYLHLHRN